MNAADFVQLLERVKPTKDGYVARCPAHPDRVPSLSVTDRDNRVLLHCFAGCSEEDILGRLGVEKDSLYHDAGDEVAYDYRDENGTLLFQVVRMPGKKFLQRRANGEWGLNGTRRVPYRLPELLRGIKAGARIYIVEGEKDADAIYAAGGFATCNPGGAGKWLPDYNEWFKDARVRIVRDNDDVGRNHGRDVARALQPVARNIHILEARSGKDAYDHLKAGHSLTDFETVERKLNFKPLDLRQPPPETKWLVDDLAVQFEVWEIVAESGVGKSYFALAGGLAVAGNQDWFLGRKVHKHGCVVYVDEEMSTDLAQQRSYQLGYDPAVHHPNMHYLSNQEINLASDSGFGRFMEDMEIVKPVLVILDSQSQVAVGIVENDNDAMTEFYKTRVKPIARQTGAAVWIVHHASDGASKPRGASAIKASGDQTLSIRRSEDGVLTLWPSKERRRTRRVMFTIDDVPDGRIGVHVADKMPGVM